MNVAVVDYKMGNLGSVLKAMRAVGAEVTVIETPDALEKFSCCILPGVGNFGDGMRNLEASGFVPALKKYVSGGKWLFGICLGMQMMLESSEEAPGVAGLGLFPGAVRRFPAGSEKVPQIGWNTVRFRDGTLLAARLPQEAWFYFVHSYYVPVAQYTVGQAEYILPFSAAIGGGHCFAAQFHPEKSQRCGLALLENFLAMAGEGTR